MLSKGELWRLVDYCKLSSLAHQRPCDGGGPSAGTSLALQALYANDAVKHSLADLTPFSKPRDPDPDNDSEDDEDDEDDDASWEEMDLITFARYYAATSPHLARVVQEHDRKMRERFDQRIATWLEGVQFVRS